MANLQTVTLDLGEAGKRPFSHRGTPADLGVVQQMFVAQDYALARLRRGAEMQAIYEALATGAGRPLILDAGANIGASVVYFGGAFPRAHILALEPARENFALLQANTTGIDLDARCAAIGASAGELALVDPGLGEWGYRTVDAPGGVRVPVLAAAQLVAEKRAAGFEPFIAKIDIEGGEAELFSRDTDWVDEFPLLIIELHDWLLPGSANSSNFLKCVAARNRDFVYSGENIFSIANDL
jgi:FkbM family methyltransferase